MANATALTCYTVGLNFVTSSNQYFPCTATDGSGNTSCCYAGDYCLEDGICHYTHEVQGGTGYYLGGCTDPTWRSESCHKECTSEYGADVVYDMAAGHWNCCVSTSERLDCKNPSNFTINAPAPENLSTIKQINIPVPSSAELTPIGSITSVPSTGSGSVRANATMSTAASANMTLTFSGTPMQSTSSAFATTSQHRSNQQTALTSSAATRETQQTTRTSAAPASTSSGNVAPSRPQGASKLSVVVLLAGLSFLALV